MSSHPLKTLAIQTTHTHSFILRMNSSSSCVEVIIKDEKRSLIKDCVTLCTVILLSQEFLPLLKKVESDGA